MVQGLLPHRAFGRKGATLQIGKGGVVRRHHARAGAGFDGHVAHRQTLLNAHGANGRTGVFDDMSRRPIGAELGNDGQDHIFGADMRTAHPLNPHAQGFGAPLPGGLGGQHVGDFARASAKSQSAQGAVGGGVGVTAHQHHAGLGEALFGADHMHDALARVAQGKVQDAVGLGVFHQTLDHPALFSVGDRRHHMAAGGDAVVGGGHHLIGAADGQALFFQKLKCMDRSVMHQMACHMQQALAIVAIEHFVCMPNFFVQGQAHGVLLL